MPTLKLTLLTLFITSLCLQAESYRKWTEASTKRSIVAKIKDKKLDNSEAQLLTKQGKVMWFKSEDLVSEDQVYIKKWVKPVDHLTVKVIGSKKGGKKLEVTAVAGSQAMKVRCHRGRHKKPLEKKLKVGQTITFEYWAPREYWVRAFYGKKMVDEETEKSKTGL